MGGGQHTRVIGAEEEATRTGGPNAVGAGVRRAATALLAALVIVAVLGPLPTRAQIADPNWSAPRTVYIPDTGHSIDGLFLDLWRSSGGINAFGNPITPEITLDNGHIIQYYEYARFEYWPETDGFGNSVVLGSIGSELRPVAIRRATTAPEPISKERGSGAAQQLTASIELRAMNNAWLPLPASAASSDSATRRYVPETGHTVSNGFKAFWEATGGAAYLGNPLTEEYQSGEIVYQVFERGQLAWEQGGDPYMVQLGRTLAAKYGLSTAAMAQGDIPTYSEELWVPKILRPGSPPAGPVPGYSKTIVISLSEQALWALEGDEVAMKTYISSGRIPTFATPPGTFYVNSKVPVQDMEGILGGEYYNVTDVPDVMYFTNVGHAIHGTYWHSNFGNPMSHGCINVPLDTSNWLFNWTPMGTPVVIVP